jgi:hypothetical protein
MAINFFDRELSRLEERFNSTFGEDPKFKPDLRACTMLSIVWLGMIAKHINSAKKKDSVRSEIQEFVYGRHALDKLFDLADLELTEKIKFSEFEPEQKLVAVN